jgi:hypothetical protein
MRLATRLGFEEHAERDPKVLAVGEEDIELVELSGRNCNMR